MDDFSTDDQMSIWDIPVIEGKVSLEPHNIDTGLSNEDLPLDLAETPTCDSINDNKDDDIASTEKPKFVPKLRFGPNINNYKGKLYLSSTVFTVSLSRQKRGFYAISGTLSLISPADGRILQKNGDRLTEVINRRGARGCKPLTSKHAFATAASVEINLKPQKNPDFTESIKNVVINRAKTLRSAFLDQLTDLTLFGTPMERLPLKTLCAGYIDAYADSCAKSQSKKASLKRTLNDVADVLGETKLAAWRKQTFINAEKKSSYISSDSIKEVLNFLNFVSQKRREESNPVATCLESYLATKETVSPETYQTDAVKAVALPQELELNLESMCWENIGHPKYMYIMFTKESGLSADVSCELTFGDIILNPTEKETIFISYHRNNIVSSTHDYTFPLFPVGAVYLHAYMEYLEKTYGADRIGKDRYILSDCADGTKKIESKKLKNFINELLSHHKLGYAELVGLKELNIRRSRGEALLVKAYEKRIRSIFTGTGCKAVDDGAASFMMHQILVNSVQTDHYRGFTDQTGRYFLAASLRKDPRDPYQYSKLDEQPHRRKRAAWKYTPDGTGKQYIYPARSRVHRLIYEVSFENLKAGDEVTIEAPGGVLVKELKEN